MRVGCVICGDLFILSEDISAAPCGHTFHSVCIFQWIERSKSCPQCRHKATQKSLLKLYFDCGSAEPSDVDPDSLQQQIDNHKFQIRLKEQEINKLKESTSTLTTQNKNLRAEYKLVEERVKTKETTILALKTQLQFVDRVTKEAQKAKDETKNLREQLKLLQHAELVVNGQIGDVEEMLCSYDNSPGSTRDLATFCSILKKELSKTIEEKRKQRDEALLYKRKVKETRQNHETVVTKMDTLEQANTNLKEDIQSLERENSSLKKKVQALQEAIASPSGDIKNSAIHRLLAESPAPAVLKRSHREPQNDDPVVTPEVVRKMARADKVVLSSDEEHLTIDLSAPSSSQAQKVNRHPLNDTINLGISVTAHHHNIFAKPRVKKTSDLAGNSNSSSTITNNAGDKVGYDGLGGHHKVDEFPKPNPLMMRKKKGIRITTKYGASSRVQTSTIKNYFHNTFED